MVMLHHRKENLSLIASFDSLSINEKPAAAGFLWEFFSVDTEFCDSSQIV